MTRNQRLLVLLGILISIVFLVLAFNQLRPAEVLAYIGQANPLWLLVSLPVFIASVIVIAYRWGFLLRALRPLPLHYLFEIVNIGYMGNNVYPLRAGEILRILLLQRDYQIPVARTTTTIFVERIFDGLICLGFILFPALLVENLVSAELRTGAVAATPLFIVGALVFFVLAARPDALRRLSAFFARFLPPVLERLTQKLTQDVIDGTESLRQPRYLIGTICYSLLTWALQGVTYYLVGLAFGFQVDFLVMLLAVGAVNMSGALPATPGQIGVFEFFASQVVIAAGVQPDQALAFAVVLHVIIWLPPTLLGFFYLARRGLGFGSIIDAARKHTLEKTSPSGETVGQQSINI